MTTTKPSEPRGRTTAQLLEDARAKLGLLRGPLGAQLGSSRRTVSRWFSGRTLPSHAQLLDLARRVRARDEALATEIEQHADHVWYERRGKPPPPRPAAPASPASTGLGSAATMLRADVHLVDAIVCVSAEAMNLSPVLVRAGLRAAFRRAREVGLDVATIERLLVASSSPSEASPTQTESASSPGSSRRT